MLAFLGNLCYTKQVPNARVQKKHKKLIWLRGQAVKTLASHAGIRGSIPLGVTERIPGSAWKSSASGFFHVYVPENGGTKGANYKIFISWI